MAAQIVTPGFVRAVVQKYKRAWESQDPVLILEIFHENATYHEYILRDQPKKGHKEIEQYWIEKVCTEQSNIHMDIQNIYTDGAIGIAEWRVTFTNKTNNKQYTLQQIAVMEFEGERIQHYREYWHSEKNSA